MSKPNYSYQPLVSSQVNDYNSVFSYSDHKNKQAGRAGTYYEDFTISLPTKHIETKQACLDWICTSLIKIFCYLSFLLTLPFSAIACIKLCHQFERIVVYRIGRLQNVKGPGFILILPCIDTWKRIDMRTKAFNIPPTKLRTQDGCIISIGGVVHFAVKNPVMMTSSVQDMNHSVRVISQSSMTNFLCKKNVTDIMNSRGKYNYDIQVDINQVAKDWGLEINRVELSQVTVEFTPSAKQQSGPSIPMGDGGDLPIETLTMLAQQFLSAPKPAPTAQIQEVPMTPQFSSPAEVLHSVQKSLSQELVNNVNATYEIKLSDQNETYYIDLKYGSGDCGVGKLQTEEPDVKFEMSFPTMQKFFAKQLKPYDAYWSGELKVTGDKNKALDIEKLIQTVM